MTIDHCPLPIHSPYHQFHLDGLNKKSFPVEFSLHKKRFLTLLPLVKGGKIFTKGDKVRKRFLCKENSTGKLFLFSPVAEVELGKVNGEW